MTRKLSRPLLLAFSLLGLLVVTQSLALADVSMTLTGTPSGSLGGVYTSPYIITVNGTQVLASCDDFGTDISVGYTWSAIENALANVQPSGPQKFDGSKTYDTTNVSGGEVSSTVYSIQAQYTAAAFLAQDILTSSGIAAEEYSYALWNLFDPTGGTGNSPGAINTLYASNAEGAANDQAYAKQSLTYMFQALTEATNGTTPVPNIIIYTPDGKSTSQEFIQVVPERSSLANLGFELFAVFAGIFLVRRRLLRVI